MSFPTILNNSSELHHTQEYLPIKHDLLTASSQAESASFCILCCQPCWTGQSSVWGRWTISRSYYCCNYTHLRPPWEHNTRRGSAHKKPSLVLSGSQTQSLVQIHVNIHISFTTLTGKPFPFLLESSPRPSSHPAICIFGRTDSSEALARRVWWICEGLAYLTQIDPVGQKNGGYTCSKIVNYHFKEVPRKG